MTKKTSDKFFLGTSLAKYQKYDETQYEVLFICVSNLCISYITKHVDKMCL